MEAPADSKITWLTHNPEVDPSDMTWFAFNFMYYMAAMIIAAKILEDFIFPKFLPNYREHSLRSIRNLVTYVLEVVITTYLFYIQVTSGMRVITEKYTTYDVEMGRVPILVLSCLYLFELIYRLEMNVQLTVHHVLTLLCAVFGIQALHDTRDAKFMNCITLLSLTATTEQPSFIALFMYRIKHKYSGYALRFSAIQTLLTKTMFLIALGREGIELVWSPRPTYNPYNIEWYYRWRVLVIVFSSILFVTQAYGAWVMWKLGSPRRKYSDSPRKDDNHKQVEEKKIEEVVPPVMTHFKHA